VARCLCCSPTLLLSYACLFLLPKMCLGSAGFVPCESSSGRRIPPIYCCCWNADAHVFLGQSLECISTVQIVLAIGSFLVGALARAAKARSGSGTHMPFLHIVPSPASFSELMWSQSKYLEDGVDCSAAWMQQFSCRELVLPRNRGGSLLWPVAIGSHTW
jgi:hypothetical protein